MSQFASRLRTSQVVPQSQAASQSAGQNTGAKGQEEQINAFTAKEVRKIQQQVREILSTQSQAEYLEIQSQVRNGTLQNRRGIDTKSLGDIIAAVTENQTAQNIKINVPKILKKEEKNESITRLQFQKAVLQAMNVHLDKSATPQFVQTVYTRQIADLKMAYGYGCRTITAIHNLETMYPSLPTCKKRSKYVYVLPTPAPPSTKRPE